MGLLVNKPLEKPRLFCLSLVGGIVLGAGIWARQDLNVFILPFVLLLILFLPGSVKDNIKIKVAALILFAIGLLWFINPTSMNRLYFAPHRIMGGLVSYRYLCFRSPGRKGSQEILQKMY